jgi:hypothetical protein
MADSLVTRELAVGSHSISISDDPTLRWSASLIAGEHGAENSGTSLPSH